VSGYKVDLTLEVGETKVRCRGRIDEDCDHDDASNPVAEWLSRIDPGELDHAAMNGATLSNGTPASDYLEVLKYWASGGA
jgi:hypothetical protein